MLRRALIIGRALLVFLVLWVCVAEPAFADDVTLLGVSTGQKVSGGGASPTWTPNATLFVPTCSGTSCTQTGVTVVSGYVVVAATYYQATTLTGITVCGTALTPIVQASYSSGGNTAGAIFGGTVTGGSCSVVISAATSGITATMGIGTLNNLSSTTATSTCSGTTVSSGGPNYACSSALTVPSNGFAIALSTQGGGSVVAFTNMTDDATQNAASPSTTLGHSSTAGSLTPTFTSSYGGGQTTLVVGATWH